MFTASFTQILARSISAEGRAVARESRRQRLARELRKVNALSPGSTYTLVFLGIHSGEFEADGSFTAQAMPGFSGCLGLGEIDLGTWGNAGILPNGNWAHRAWIGKANRSQMQMATALIEAAQARGLRLNLITHSNGINAAAAALNATGARIQNAVVLAPNTASARRIQTLAGVAERFTLITSDADERLRLAPFAHRQAGFWARCLRTLPQAAVLATTQAGHGGQCYLTELLAGRVRWNPAL